MKPEQFVLILALIGSVISLKNEVISIFARLAARHKQKLEQEAKALEEAKAQLQADAQARQIESAQQSMQAFMKSIRGLNGAIAGFAPAQEEGAAQQVAEPQKPSGKPMGPLTIEEQLQWLAETVIAQSEQLERINAMQAAPAEPQQRRRQTARKGGNEAVLSASASGAAPAAAAKRKGGGDAIPLEGLELGPEPQRTGDFEVVPH